MMKFRHPMLAATIAAALTSQAAIAEAGVVKAAFPYFQKLLDQHLIEKDLDSDGLVSAFDYEAALHADETERLLENQNQLMAEFDVSRLDTREKAIAFWNNAYNYFMIEQILTELDGGELVGSVWDYGGRYNPFRDSVFEREKFNIGGEKYSLSQMEKDVMLGDEYKEKGWKEARVHFTVNCASVGCPPLRTEVYTADNIEQLMTENTRRAFNTPRQLRVEGSTLYLSKLFDWYEDDYVEEEGSIRAFIEAYADDHIIEKIQGTNRIRFIDYDWNLNKPANFPEMN